MKYITCEGRFSIIYGYHFRLLCELMHGIDLPPAKKQSIPYFLLQSLIECGTKLNEAILDQLAHHGLIKLLVEDSLHTYTIPISWETFRNMSREDNIRTLIENITPSSSEEGEQIEEMEKKNDEGAQDVQEKAKQRKHMKNKKKLARLLSLKQRKKQQQKHQGKIGCKVERKRPRKSK